MTDRIYDLVTEKLTFRTSDEMYLLVINIVYSVIMLTILHDTSGL